MSWRRLVLILLAGLLFPWHRAPAGGGDRADDEHRLAAAGLATDGPGLLDFFRRRTIHATADDVGKLIEQLGDPSFAAREEASDRLTAVGALALPALARADGHADPEVRRRADECRRRIETAADAPLVSAAAGLLADRKPAGAAAALLDYLPARADEPTREALRTALAAVAVRDGRPEPAVLRALGDESPECRAAAGVALCRAGAAEPMPAIRKLLHDADPHVRLAVALALADHGDKEAVPALIALLDVLPRHLLAPAEDLLYALAGPKAPALAMGKDGASRRRFRDAWADWWARAGDVDLRRAREAPYLDHTVVLLLDESRMIELDADDKPVWEMKDLGFPLDLQVLPGQRVLVADNQGNRVVERHHDGTVLWEYDVGGPLVAQRLANGNTFIATRTELLEVDRAGTVVFSYVRPDGNQFMRAAKLPDGDVACVTLDQRFVRLDPSGREKGGFEVRVTTSGGRIDVQPDGRVLVPQMSQDRVVEYDAKGKEVRAFVVKQPIAAVRLANGNTLVTSMAEQRAVELDPAGKEVWQHSPKTRVNRAWRR